MASGGDTNRPALVVVPMWGADVASQRMSVNVSRYSNPASSAGIGPGITQDSAGSQGRKTDAWFAQPQAFRGLVHAITRPSVPNLDKTAEFPSTTSVVDPVLLALSAKQIARL